MDAQNRHDSELIDRIGGTVTAAQFFEVRPQAVSQWRHTGIPRARMLHLRAAKPELFADAAANVAEPLKAA
jgi:hypothetical protein